MAEELLTIEFEKSTGSYVFKEFCSEEKTLDAFAAYLVLISENGAEAIAWLQKLANTLPQHLEAKFSTAFKITNHTEKDFPVKTRPKPIPTPTPRNRMKPTKAKVKTKAKAKVKK